MLSRLYADLPEINRKTRGTRGGFFSFPSLSSSEKGSSLVGEREEANLPRGGHDRPFSPVSPPHGSLVLCGRVLSRACCVLCTLRDLVCWWLVVSAGLPLLS